MPTVLKIGPYRFQFYVSDEKEPIHIHVVRDRKKAKFWLQPVRLANRAGFKQAELNDIEKIIFKHEQVLVESWNEQFN